MPRKLLKRLLPSPETMKQHQSLGVISHLLHDPNLWHLNRNCVASATFIGLFVAFIPLPAQMLIAALAAILLRANLAISVLLVWVTNPVTILPMFYLAFKVGSVLMNVPVQQAPMEMSYEWLSSQLNGAAVPFILGCVVCGLFFGLLGAFIVRWLWRLHVLRSWRARHSSRNTDAG